MTHPLGDWGILNPVRNLVYTYVAKPFINLFDYYKDRIIALSSLIYEIYLLGQHFVDSLKRKFREVLKAARKYAYELFVYIRHKLIAPIERFLNEVKKYWDKIEYIFRNYYFKLVRILRDFYTKISYFIKELFDKAVYFFKRLFTRTRSIIENFYDEIVYFFRHLFASVRIIVEKPLIWLEEKIRIIIERLAYFLYVILLEVIDTIW